MGIVSTDKLKEDMVLSDDVKDVNGRLLLAKGVTLQSKQIRMLKMWGVTEANVVGDSDEEEVSEPDLSPEQMKKIKEDTQYLFRHTDQDHPAIKELVRLSEMARSRQKITTTEKKKKPVKEIGPNGHKPENEIKKIISKEIKLPEIPSIVFELNEVIADLSSTAENIAQVVNKSPSLAALLLRIVNSSFYGFPSKIDKISRAVTVIGTGEISSLALGIGTITIFKDISKEIIDMPAFLKHSFACGMISRILAAAKNIPHTEQLFISGLLHDIGRLIIYQYLPEQAKTLFWRREESDKLLHEEEMDYLGQQHTDIGRDLLKKWKLPFEVENNVFYHHNPAAAHSSMQAAIVHLADIIVNALAIGSSGEKFVPPLDNKAWEELKISPNHFETVIKQAMHQLSILEPILQSQ